MRLKLNIYTKLILILLLLSVGYISYAQMIPLPTNIQSPNAMSLGMYGNTPVSYFHGTPDITIPLHTLHSGDIELPISLSYDASGVLVNSNPSWVGQNWALNAGGVITRSIQSQPDEGILTENITCTGFFWTYNLLDRQTNGSNVISLGNADLEPDIFTFNFMGKTGKFFLGNDGQWKVSSESNLDIIFDISDTEHNFASPLFPNYPDATLYGTRAFMKSIYGFKIRDDAGNLYEFGYDKNAIEYSINFFGQDPWLSSVHVADQWIANAWYLKKVTNKYGREVYKLSYERDYYIAHFYNSESTTSPIGTSGTESDFSIDKDIRGSLIAPVYLNQISSMDSTIIIFVRSNSWNIYKSNGFNAQQLAPKTYQNWLANNNDNIPLYYYFQSDRADKKYVFNAINMKNYSEPTLGLMWKKLNCIAIKNKNLPSEHEFYKTFNFQYTSDTTKRMFLNGIDIFAYDSLSLHNPLYGYENSYKFQYSNNSNLPYQLSKFEDHWGYYNPIGNSTTLNGSALSIDTTGTAGSTTTTSLSYFESRCPDPIHMQYGILTSIEYPTGGSTSFVYEPNTFSMVASLLPASYSGFGYPYTVTPTVAPLKVNSYDTPGYIYTGGGLRVKKINDFDGRDSVIRSFYYNQDYETKKRRSFFSSGILTFTPQYAASNVTVPGGATYDMSSICSIVPLSNSFDPVIGYSHVVEETKGNGYTVYNFSNYDTRILDDTINMPKPIYNYPYIKRGSRAFMRGKLVSQIAYNNNDEWVQNISNSYRHDTIDNQYVLVAEYGTSRGPSVYYTAAYAYVYKMYYPRYDIASQTRTNFLNSKVISTSTTWENKDYQIPFSSTHIADARLLKSKQITDSDNKSIVERYSYPLDAISDPFYAALTMAFRLNPYRIVHEEAGVSTKTTTVTYKSENSLFVPYQQITSYGSNPNSHIDLTCNRYDAFGNLLQYESNGLITSILWGNNSTVPIGVFRNMTYATIPTDAIQTLQQSSITNEVIQNRFNQLRLQYTNAQISNYTYNTLKDLLTETSAQNVTKYYLYDCLGRLATIKNDDNNIIANFRYHYQNNNITTLYYNNAMSQTFTKDSCGVGYIGTDVTYTVSAQKYSSSISQADADLKAQNEIQLRGQLYANSNGNCILIACSGVDKKIVNNVCETGILVFTDSQIILGSSPMRSECTYHYEWSDGSWSQNYLMEVNGACFVSE